MIGQYECRRGHREEPWISAKTLRKHCRVCADMRRDQYRLELKDMQKMANMEARNKLIRLVNEQWQTGILRAQEFVDQATAFTTISRRDYFAAMALQGLIMRVNEEDYATSAAVEIADRMLRELDKEVLHESKTAGNHV